MALLSVCKLGVYFVRKDHYVGVPKHVRNFLKVLSSHNAAGGVVWEREHEELRFRSYGGAKLFGGKAEIVLLFCLNGYDVAARKAANGLIADERRDRKEHIVAGLDERPNHKVDCFGAADGDKNFLLRVIFDIEFALKIFCGFLTKLHKTGVSRVPGASFFEGINTRFADVPGSFEIRFADAEGDNVVHLRREVKKFTYSGGLYSNSLFGKSAAVINQDKKASSRPFPVR